MPQQLPESRGTRNFQSGISCLDIRASCLSEHMEKESSIQAIHASWELVQNVAKLFSAECESRIYTCDYEIVAIALSSTIATACSITLVVAGIDLAIEY
ncbi:hypothetical protein ALC53_04279 [Atta colombica]|uniref:Uncharacterized protein n=1 Tax=Atta colombica TaxID=520822 RepID=A0A151I505_9HYME|nr:hypothetical protein ALC53_04279 [Atta colombica]